MSTVYTETPNNIDEFKQFIIEDVNEIKKFFLTKGKIIFYDACSFQRYSKLKDREKQIIINYYKKNEITIFITRCILMELASDKHILCKEYVEFIKFIVNNGIKIVLFNEEYTYNILSECFSTNEKINEYLVWAVRMSKSPVSTITESLKANPKFSDNILKGKNLKYSDIYFKFFSMVRNNKQHKDNLGEELIAICIHILSHLPGVYDGKLSVVTDDKGAAGKIDSITKKTNKQYKGSKIVLFSTPKLVQHIYNEKISISENEMANILSQGVSGKIVVMGTTSYDLEIDRTISMTSKELTRKIMEPNGINIVF